MEIEVVLEQLHPYTITTSQQTYSIPQHQL